MEYLTSSETHPLPENVTLNFAKFKVEYTEQDAKGAGGKTSTAAWDISANKAIG